MSNKTNGSSTSVKAQKRKLTELLDIDESLIYFTRAFTSKVLRGNVELSLHLDVVDNHSKETGLNPEQLSILLATIGRGTFSQNVLTRLVKCLIPSGGVSASIAIGVVSHLSVEKLSWTVKKLLVQWLVVVYELIDDQDAFHCVYSLLFHFVRSEILCPSICQLLYLMTEKEDVQLWRVKRLLAMGKAVGVAPHLLSLLTIYKLYRPDLVAVSLPPRQRVLFKQTVTDRKWSSYIRRVQEKRRRSESLNLSLNQPLEHLSNSAVGKSLRDDMFPFTCTVDTSPEIRNSEWRKRNRVNIEHIKTFKQLLEHLDRLRIPAQVGSVLRNDFLQHIFALCTDVVAPQRFMFWISHLLQEEFGNSCHKNKLLRQTRLLEKLLKFQDFLCESCFVVETFLTRYLHTWNGHEHIVYILEMVSKHSLVTFEKMDALILEPLKKIFICSAVNTQCKILWSLTELIQNLSAVEWPKLKRQWRVLEQNHTPNVVQDNSHCRLFSIDDDEMGRVESLAHLAQFVDELCSTALRLSSAHIVVQHMVLNYYEVLCDLQLWHKIPISFVPNSHVFYTFLFANNLPTVNRVAQILCRYRECFENMRSPENELTLQEIKVRQLSLNIQKLNIYILDVSDTLWRYKAFNPSSVNSVYSMVDPKQLAKIQVEKPSYMLSLHCHQALIGFVFSYLKQTQRNESSVHPCNLKELREKLVEYFCQCGASGVSNFLEVFLPNRVKPIRT